LAAHHLLHPTKLEVCPTLLDDEVYTAMFKNLELESEVISPAARRGSERLSSRPAGTLEAAV
jgi:hypothetical protein